MSKNNETFSYSSASQNKEVEAIRKKYISDSTDSATYKLEQLLRLDRSVDKKALTLSLSVGIVSTLIMGSGMSFVMTDIGTNIGMTATTLPGILIGFIGVMGVIFTYPLYRRTIVKERKKLAPKILKLTDELSKISF